MGIGACARIFLYLGDWQYRSSDHWQRGIDRLAELWYDGPSLGNSVERQTPPDWGAHNAPLGQDMTMSTYNRNEVIAALSLVWSSDEWSETSLAFCNGKAWQGVSKGELLWLMEIARLVTKAGGQRMSETLLKYRANYVPTTSYSGRKSLNNGDLVAEFLAGMEPLEVLAAAEQILGFETGELVAKYQHLNVGQMRMNGGNRLRAAIKRGDITAADLH